MSLTVTQATCVRDVVQETALLEYLNNYFICHFVHVSNYILICNRKNVKLPIPGIISGNNFENDR